MKINFILGLLVMILLIGIFFNYGGSFITGLVTDGNFLSSSNFIDTEDIIVYDDRIVIKVSNVSISNYDDSGSMLPIINKDANGIKVKPSSPDQIGVGDIITYRSNHERIVHRVVEKGIDEKGIYFITKGDNNPVNDNKVRFSQIEEITIGILY
jgi:signal peptidase I